MTTAKIIQRFAKPVGYGLATATLGGALTYNESKAGPLALTPYRAVSAASVIAKPAAKGYFLGQRDEGPINGVYNEELRDALHTSESPQIFNVNLSLDNARVKLEKETLNIIKSHEKENPISGSGHDLAWEHETANAFHQAYKNCLVIGKQRQREGAPLAELQEIGRQATFNAVGYGAHTIFGAFKAFKENLSENATLTKTEIFERHEKKEASYVAHKERIENKLSAEEGAQITQKFKRPIQQLREQIKNTVEEKNLSETKNNPSF